MDLDEMLRKKMPLKTLDSTPRSEILAMDVKSIAFGMKLARDAIQVTCRAIGSKEMLIFADELDRFPIIGEKE